MSKIDFLPTKIKYNSKNNCIRMYYRLKRSNKLYIAEIPFDHYIYTSGSYRRMNPNEAVYDLLGTNEKLIKNYMKPYEAFKFYKNKGDIIPMGEADLSAEKRFVVDTFYNVDFPTNIDPRIYFLDIEADAYDNELPRFNHNIAEINAITIFDNYTEKYYCWFLTPENNTNSNEKITEKILNLSKEYGEIYIQIFKKPKNLLISFVNYIHLNCPDILTIWYSKFDVPYLCRKIYDHLGEAGLKKLSPYGYVSNKIKNALETGVDLEIDNLIPGIDSIDMLELYKNYAETQKPSYALKNIAKEELEEDKLFTTEDNKIRNLSEFYNNEFEYFCRYNIQDVRLMVMLEEKLKILNLAKVIRNISKINFSDIFYETRIIDNILLMEAVRRREEEDYKYVLPSRPQWTPKKDYLGAFVKKTIPGLYKWISNLDFKSMYPCIDKTFMISPETIVSKISNYQLITLLTLAKNFEINDLSYIKENLLPKYLTYDPEMLKFINENKNIDYNKAESYELDINLECYQLYSDLYASFKNLRELRLWLKKNNFCFLPSGIIVDQNKEDAILPKIVSDVMESREKYKKLMLYNLEKGNENLYKLYDVYQTAVKLINNAIYGATANEKFRLHNLDISSGITTSGQLLIKATTYLTNIVLNNLSDTKDKDYVITNDTDSIIFTLQGFVDHDPKERNIKILEKISNYAVQCQNNVNESLYDICRQVFYKTNINTRNNFMTIKNEWLADSGLFLAKKCYAIHTLYSEGILYEKLKPKGISLRRSSTPNALKPFIEKVLVKILNFSEKSIIDEIIIEECKKIKNEYDIKDIALPISVNNIDSYKNLPIHVRGAKIWNNYFAEEEMDKIITGKVKYIYVKKWKNNELNIKKEYVISIPDNTYYWELNKDKFTVDYKKMKERLIINPIKGFYDALNWKIPIEILSENNGVFIKFINKSSKRKIKLI